MVCACVDVCVDACVFVCKGLYPQSAEYVVCGEGAAPLSLDLALIALQITRLHLEHLLGVWLFGTEHR